MTALNGSKMFFWESTQVGFVTYPLWLQKIYDLKIFDDLLRFSLFLLSLAAVVLIWHQSFTASPDKMVFLIGILIFLYIAIFYSWS